MKFKKKKNLVNDSSRKGVEYARLKIKNLHWKKTSPNLHEDKVFGIRQDKRSKG